MHPPEFHLRIKPLALRAMEHLHLMVWNTRSSTPRGWDGSSSEFSYKNTIAIVSCFGGGL